MPETDPTQGSFTPTEAAPELQRTGAPEDAPRPHANLAPGEVPGPDGRAQLQRRPDQAPASTGASDPATMLNNAIERGYDPQTLQQLIEVYRQWEADQARKAFDRAMAAFRADPPKIRKNHRVRFVGKNNSVTDYKHATLDHVCEALSPKLAPLGLSYRWSTQQPDAQTVQVTTIVTHEAGHYEQVTLHAPIDTSGNKNPIQQIGSTVTFLQRYGLFAAFGLAAEDQDDDAQGAGAGGRSAPPSPISEEQRANLQDLLAEVEPAERREQTRTLLLQHYGIAQLGELTARDYKDCTRRLEHVRQHNPTTD